MIKGVENGHPQLSNILQFFVLQESRMSGIIFGVT